MNQTSKESGLVIDREGVINLVQMLSIGKLISRYEDPDASQVEADLAREGVSNLVKEIEQHVPRGEA